MDVDQHQLWKEGANEMNGKGSRGNSSRDVCTLI